MKQTLGIDDIAQELRHEFSSGAARALAEYLEDLDPDAELDVVDVRCSFCEFESLEKWAEDYDPDHWTNFLTYDDPAGAIREYIHERGILIEFDGGVVVSNF